jgi:hypothetical protein
MMRRMKLLDLAAGSMDILGAVAVGWYVASKYQHRVRRDADQKLAFGEPPAAAALLTEPGLSLELSNVDPAGDDMETGAEELLAARIGRFGDPFIKIIAGWWEWIWRRLTLVGWLRLVLLAPVSLALFALLMVFCALLLPFLIVSFLFDADNDFRLRIIVLTFALGICLQIASALAG